MNVKFMWNGIKIDGQLYRARYSVGPYTPQSKLPADTITVYFRDYQQFPQVSGLSIQNDSDSMTDYFERDRLRILPDSRFHREALAAKSLAEQHHAKRYAKRTA